MSPRLLSFTMAQPLGRCVAECSVSSSARCSSIVRGFSSTSSSTPSPYTRHSRTAARPRPSLPFPASTASFHTSSAACAGGATALSRTKIALPEDYVPPTQPPTARQPDTRKAQLLRTYTSLVRTTPLMLLFQHNNLTGPEWAALRRELTLALRRVGEEQKQLGIEWPEDLPSHIHLQVVQKGLLSMAFRLVEFFDPSKVTAESTRAATEAVGKRFKGAPGVIYNHDLSAAANIAVKEAEAAGATSPERSAFGQLQPLLVGPLAALTFPVVSPAHLAAALSVLAPNAPAFPPPTRRKSPSYYEPAVQNGLQKLMLVGGRVEGRVFDMDGVRWVGSIQGGKAGLQAQLVTLLQSAGLGLTTALEGASKSLWLTMESRKTMLEEGGAEAPKEP